MELTCNNESAIEISPPIEFVTVKEEIDDNFVLQDENVLEREEAMEENDEFRTIKYLENINDNMQYDSSVCEENHVENFLNRVKQETGFNLIDEEIQIKDELLLEATDCDSEDISNNKLLNEGKNKPDCNSNFSEGGKNMGMEQNVNSAKRFKCDKCHKAFSYPSPLKRHSRIHTGEKPYECDICNKAFSTKDHLIVHKRIHNKERPFKCLVCHKAFTISGSLTEHMRTHTGEKPFHCQFCQYKCTKNSSLKMHVRIHTGEKPFQCQVCQYKFAQPAHLNMHMRIHTGEKSFTCKHCQKAFSRGCVLKRHMRTNHIDQI